MAKNLEIAVLLDLYGDMLTEKQRDFLGYYYNDDLSLSEIAENEGITRQGVRDAMSVKRPTVFIETVLPPVFGPVITSVSKSVPSLISTGTTLFLSMSGCRAARSSISPSELSSGTVAPIE